MYYFKKTSEGCYYIKTTAWKHLNGDDVSLALLLPDDFEKPLSVVMKIINDLNNGGKKRLLERYYEGTLSHNS